MYEAQNHSITDNRIIKDWLWSAVWLYIKMLSDNCSNKLS